MSLYPLIAEDDITANHRSSHAFNSYTAFEHRILGLNPNVDLQACVFPPLPSPKMIAPSLNLSPLLRSSSYPVIERSHLNAAHFNRHLCDLFTPTYEPLWTPNGEIPDPDDGVCGTVDVSTDQTVSIAITDHFPYQCIQALARRFPRYGRLISAANPHNPRSVKKVKDLVLRYIKEERENSWGSTTVDPRLTWQVTAPDLQENEIPTVRTWYLTRLNSEYSLSPVLKH